MSQPRNRLFSVSDFAKFSRTTRDTLHYYDRIGLLVPLSRGGNKYRYYTSRQLSIVNLIRTLQALGLSLNEIKDIKDNRSPEMVDKFLISQIEKIDIKINDWVRARELLFMLHKSINAVLNVNEQEITIQFMPMEAIVLGGLNDYSKGRTDYDALFSFYRDMAKTHHDLDLNYPVWGIISEERVKRRDWGWPDRYYFYNPKGRDKKPAALYATGYMRCGYGKCVDLYNRITEYTDENGFEICGDAFEEYPLNELCVLDDDNYLVRIMIPVRKKE